MATVRSKAINGSPRRVRPNIFRKGTMSSWAMAYNRRGAA